MPPSFQPSNPLLRLQPSTFNQQYFNHCLIGTMIYWLSSTVIVYSAKYIPDFDTGKTRLFLISQRFRSLRAILLPRAG